MLQIVLILFTLNFSEASPLKILNLCASGERIIFSCSTASGKLISLCASSDLSKTAGSLQYRFGRPSKVELQYPATKEKSAQSFKYAHYFRAQVDRTHINFKNGNASYSIFDEYDGESTPSTHETGVRAMPGNVTVHCKGKVDADYSDLGDILKCDRVDPVGLGCG